MTMTIETPVIEEPKPPTNAEIIAQKDEHIAWLEKNIKELNDAITAMRSEKAKDDATIARLAGESNAMALAFNGLKAQAEEGASTLQQIAKLANGGVDIVGVLGEVESALGKIKSKMAK
jgi:chromosome segregation ATPase